MRTVCCAFDEGQADRLTNYYVAACVPSCGFLPMPQSLSVKSKYVSLNRKMSKWRVPFFFGIEMSMRITTDRRDEYRKSQGQKHTDRCEGIVVRFCCTCQTCKDILKIARRGLLEYVDGLLTIASQLESVSLASDGQL